MSTVVYLLAAYGAVTLFVRVLVHIAAPTSDEELAKAMGERGAPVSVAAMLAEKYGRPL